MRSGTKYALILLFLLLCRGTGWAEVVDRIAAVVNGDVILRSEVLERIQAVQKVTPETRELDAKVVELEVLKQLIRERLTEAEVKRLKVNVSAKELETAIQQIKKDNGFTDAQLEYMLSQDGQTMAQFKEGIRKELERGHLLDRVLKNKTVVTEAQVDAYLKGGGKAISADRRRIAIIFIPNDAQDKQGTQAEKLAMDIHRRLQEGADFGKLANQYSKGPAANEGGDIGYITSDELAPAIAAATLKLKANEFTSPVKVAVGYYIIKVIDIQQVKQDPGNATAREKARRQLFQQELNRKYDEWVRDLEARAFIQISQ